MTDREKVIKGLECCIGQFPGEDYCKTCSYQPYRFGKCKTDAITDALAMLKEQEPTEPVMKKGRLFTAPTCRKCGYFFPSGTKPNYCQECGQAVKWDD